MVTIHKFRWTASKLDDILRCGLKYKFGYLDRIKTPIPAEMALGSSLHRRFHRFPKEGPKRKTAQAYANFFGGVWERQHINTGMLEGQTIAWKYKNQAYEFKKDVKSILKNFYNLRKIEDHPVFSEHKFEFIIETENKKKNEIRVRTFTGKIDFLDYGPLVRDYKTGKWQPSILEIESGPQIIIYNVGVGYLAHNDDGLRKKIGLSKEEAKNLGGHPDYISEEITNELFFSRSLLSVPVILTEQHWGDLLTRIESVEDDILAGRYKSAQNKKECERCRYDKICDKKSINIRDNSDIRNKQLTLYPQRAPMEEEKAKSLRLPFPRKKRASKKRLAAKS